MWIAFLCFYVGAYFTLRKELCLSVVSRDPAVSFYTHGSESSASTEIYCISDAAKSINLDIS